MQNIKHGPPAATEIRVEFKTKQYQLIIKEAAEIIFSTKGKGLHKLSNLENRTRKDSQMFLGMWYTPVLSDFLTRSWKHELKFLHTLYIYNTKNFSTTSSPIEIHQCQSPVGSTETTKLAAAATYIEIQPNPSSCFERSLNQNQLR